MMNMFDVSYLLLWGVVALQTYYIVQIGRRKQVRQANPQQDPTLVHEHHGVPAGASFPQLLFDTINHGFIDIAQMKKTGFLIAFISVGCDQCKLVYPILKRFQEAGHDIQIIMLMQGSPDEIQHVIHQWQMTMPVVPIQLEDMARLQTGYYPFIYYLSSSAVVQTKSIINFEEQLNLLVKQGQLKVAV
ncbi:hypothetical protein ABD76_10630 [Paenibacillus dendritiformis]|uniref:hypothetical protein n=1 Tax=Paenibacillus dendritiformis TaxID=130049 RepID=UPI0018CF44D8|nr:hypothetical protein [Paenibacillus dendritiformis]MBG9792917.1 hypothetical protein [Paenibacillus dendritiformis]